MCLNCEQKRLLEKKSAEVLFVPCFVIVKNCLCFYLLHAGLKPGGETWFTSQQTSLTLALWTETMGQPPAKLLPLSCPYRAVPPQFPLAMAFCCWVFLPIITEKFGTVKALDNSRAVTSPAALL